LVIGLLAMILLLQTGAACRRPSDTQPPSNETAEPADSDSEPVTEDGGSPTDVEVPCLADQWGELLEEAGLAGQSLVTGGLSLTLDDAGRIAYLSGKFYPPSMDDATSVYTIQRAELTVPVRVRQGELMEAANLCPSVLTTAVLQYIEDLRTETATGEAAGSTHGEHRPQGADYNLVVTWEDGLILPVDQRQWYLLTDEGEVRPVTSDSAVRIVGKVAILQATTTQGMGASSSTPRETRMIILGPHCDNLLRIGWIDLPPSRVDGRTLGLKWADFDGDGEKEFVYLCGVPESGGYIDLHLVVGPSADGSGERVPVPNAGPTNDNTFWSRDLTGDGVPELVLWQKLFEGGEHHYLGVHRLGAGGRSLKGLFTSDGREGCDVQREYLGDGLVRIGAAGRVWEFNLSESRGAAVTPEYDEAARRGLCPTALGPFVGFTLADTDGNGTVEVVGHQCVYGVDESDRLADLRQVFRWDAAAAVFVPAGAELYSAKFGVRLEPQP